MQGIYNFLSGNISSLNKKIYLKSSMISISHAIEDIVLDFGLNAEMYVFFQEYKFFLFEKEKYEKLDRICRKIHIFARHMESNAADGFINTVFVDIQEGSPFLPEWNIILEHPDLCAVFSSSEINRDVEAEDSMRRFNGFLSFSSSTVHLASNYILEYMNATGRPYRSAYTGVQPEKAELEATKKINYFINRALNELEAKTEELIRQNVLLTGALRENDELSFEILKRLCYAAEHRDEDTALHLVRISYFSTKLYAKFEADPEKVKFLTYASLLHDIGKIGIPDSILLKPGKLTQQEFEVMKTHAAMGAKILSGSRKELVRMAEEIALYHHEKWDGTGYPHGLFGESIPLTARVVAIADVFDALLSKRVYKQPYTLEECIAIMQAEKNRHFDGKLLDGFMEELDDFISFREKIQSLSESTSAGDIFNSYFIDSDSLPYF